MIFFQDRGRRIELIVISFLFALPWIVFWRATLGQGVLTSGDASNVFYPQLLEYARALSEGRLSLWSPGMGAGFPIFAEGQIGGLYLPNLLLYRLLPTSLAISYSTLFHLSWAAVGMFLLCRILGLSVPSSVVGGWTFGLSGFLLAHAIHLGILITASWLPWTIYLQYCYHQEPPASRTRRLRLVLMGGAIGLALLGGSPQIAFLNLMAFSITGILYDLRRNSQKAGWRCVLRGFLDTAVAISFGFALAAVQLIPTVELLGLSSRITENPVYFSTYALNPAQLFQLLSPFATLGEPALDNQEFWGSIGEVALVLALLAPILRRNLFSIAMGVFGLLALSLALGSINPFFTLLSFVPIINHFRAPARFLFLFTFASALLAAIGLDALERRLDRSASGARLSLWTGGPFALAIVGLFLINSPESISFEASEVWPWIFLCGAIVLLWAGLRNHASQTRVIGLLVGLSLLEVSLNALPFLKDLDALVSPAELARVPAALSAMDPSDPYARIYLRRWATDLLPNRMLVFGKQSSQIYSPLNLARNHEYEYRLSPAMLNLLNGRYLVYGTVGELNIREEDPAWASPDYLRDAVDISPVQASQVDVMTFTRTTQGLPNGMLVGDVILTFTNGTSTKLPLRLGIETAESDLNVRGADSEVKRNRPKRTLPLFLGSNGQARAVEGTEFVAHYDLPNQGVQYAARVQVQSYLWDGALIVDDIRLTDNKGESFDVASLAKLNNYRLVYFDYGTTMLENRDAMPRAFIVHTSRIMSDPQVLEDLSATTFRPDRTVLLSEGAASDALPSVEQDDSVEIMTYRPERIDIKAKTSDSGYLVLADTWYPGWTATMDDQPVPIIRADYIFRAIPLQSGAHVIVFEYHPASFSVGAAISAFSTLIGLLMVLPWK